MYSHRLSWSAPLNRFSLKLADARSRSAHLFDLSISNPTAAGFAYPHSSIAGALAGAGSFAYQPEPSGARGAREAIAELYAARGLAVSADRLFLTSSTSEAYGFLFKLLCDPGDEVLIPLPSYPLFEYLAALESVRTVPYRLRYDGAWHIDFETLHAALSPRTRALTIVNPNNPTGSFLNREELDRVLALAKRHRLAVIADEVFCDYGLAPSPRPKPTVINSAETLTFSLNGLSKGAGMPQMKLGWIAVSGAPADIEACRDRLDLILDTYLPVGAPVQQALPRLLGLGADLQAQILSRIRGNYALLGQLLHNSPASALHTDAGWSAIIRMPNLRSEEEWLFHLLEHESVVAQPGYFFDLESEPFLVVSLLAEPEQFEEGIRRLRKAAEEVW